MEKNSASTAEMLREIFIDYCPEPQRLNWDEAIKELRQIEKYHKEKRSIQMKRIKQKPLILEL